MALNNADSNILTTFVTNNVEDHANTAEGTIQLWKGRPKRGRKRKVAGQSRADRKTLYNTNKPHINSVGKRVKEKIFDDEFICACPKRCTSRVTLEQRKKLFSQFHNMGSFAGRCAILIGCVSKDDKPIDRKYTMFGHDVCRVAFLRTLKINDSRVTVALEKHKECDTLSDNRGKSSGGRNAFPPLKKSEVCEHIESFPKYISHYTRNQTEAKYLNSELSLCKMYELYKCRYENPVSKSFYKKTFYEEFNLRFKVPKKDTCYKCDVYIAKIQTSQGAERILLEEWHKEHLEQAEALRKQMNRDLESAKLNSEIESLAYDQQKTHNCPQISTGIAYYKRQLNVNNLGIYVGSTGKSIFNVWLEFEASKGTQEVGSCLKKLIEGISHPVKALILWSDSCGGQNRSIKLVLMMIFILRNHDSLQSISMRFLLSGHSFLPNDSDFGDAERKLKKLNLYTVDDFTSVMASCRTDNPIHVERMRSNEFFSVKNLENEITNRKVDVNKSKISWLDTHEILMEKYEPFIIKMRKKIDGEFQRVNIMRRGSTIDFKNIELDELWPTGKPLSTEKVNDLQKLLELVPEDKKSFYSFLQNVTTREFVDDVDGFGEFVDFDLEDFGS